MMRNTGQLIGTVDEKKFVTAYLYNQKTNSVTTRQYALATTATVTSTSAWADIIKLPAGNTYQDSIKSYDLQAAFDNSGRSPSGNHQLCL